MADNGRLALPKTTRLCSCVIEDYFGELRQRYPDHDDFFEDQLAYRLGLRRRSSLPLVSWRKLRLSFLDRNPGADEAYAQLAREQSTARLEISMETEDAEAREKLEADESQLKSERIQLKSERIQARVEEVPGWEVCDCRSRLRKRYLFSSVGAAAAFCYFVSKVAEDFGVEPRVLQFGSRVEVVSQADEVALTDTDFDFAVRLDGLAQETA